MMLKAEEKDPPLKYDVAYIYTKETNLLPWLNRRYPEYIDPEKEFAAEAARMRAEYAMEREVRLIFGKVWEEYYLFKRSAKRAFNALTKAYPEYNWSYGGEPLYLF